MSGGAPVALRLLRALAGSGTTSATPADAPALRWSGADSVVLGVASRAASALGPFARMLDAPADLLARRPVLVAAATVLAVPVIRGMLAAPAATAVCVALVAVAGMGVLIAATRALHAGADGVIATRALLAGALMRVIFAAAITAAGGFPDEIHTYHPLAADTAACWQTGGPALLSTHPVVEHRAAYFHLLSGAYLLLGPSIVAGRLLGGLIGLAAALLAGEVGRAIGGARAAALAVAFVALHPEHALWSVTLSRDTLTTLLVLAALAVICVAPGRLLRGRLLLAAIPVALLTMNSFLVAGALAATLVVLVLAEALAGAERGAVGIAIAAVGVAVAAAALVVVGERWGPWFRPDVITAVRSRAIGTDADFLPAATFESMFDVAAFLPVGVLFVLFAPWPWEAVHLHRAAYGVLALVGAAIVVAGVVGLGAALRRRAAAAAPPVLFALVLLALLAVLEGNSGIVVRHRLPLTAVLAVGAGVLLAGRERRAAR